MALGVMLLAACAIFFINLTASGYANEFYSAAAQAGSVSWKAFLWGSLDSGNAITVDKPPAALWLMALSVRIFGLNSFAILLPEALMGVATTYLLYVTVRRYWGNWAGIVTGFIFMLTPVAALMFRFNNPDALLVLLMTGATHALLRSLEYVNHPFGNRKRTWWMVLAGALIGFGFLTKQLQVLLVLPGFALAFLLASPTGMVRRILDSLAAIGSMIVAAGWWVLLTVIVPASDRPYIGGSQRNSFLELTFGYNGFGRLTGSEEGSVIPGHGHKGGGMPAGGGRGGGMWGQTGLNRLFSGEFGTQISWLAPLSFAGIVISLLIIGRAVRTDVRRASVIAFGGWLTVTWLVFSFMAGIFHQYYTVALAPALAALVAIGAFSLWIARDKLWARIVTPILIAFTAFWDFSLAGRSQWLPWLKWAILIIGLMGALGFALDRLLRIRRLALVALVLSVVGLMAGPAAWTLYTVSQGHMGSIVLAGPSLTSGSMGGGPGGMPGGAPGGGQPGGGQAGGMAPGNMQQQGMPGGDGSPMGSYQMGQDPMNQQGQIPGGGSNSQQAPSMGSQGPGPMGQDSSGPQEESRSSGAPSMRSQRRGKSGFQGGSEGGRIRGGGLLGGGRSSSKVVAMLEKSSDSHRWAAATTGSQQAAGYQLASEKPVMAIGGFNGSDPYPSLEQFKQYVRDKQIHYYIAGEMGGHQMGGSDAATQISQWVAKHYTATTVDGVTVYDLTQQQAS
ncbi:ArnT family glycosyltransferase [Bifidobacterium mizhiense]|uniref:ArnT family glycosyltransferase n=1 Tax=Bifidobacterium mizhiense TaxID=2879940 RepID=UPI001E5D467C|nr:glycosyltransferase family 39 protein [Bifidobacterium mizhiense]